MAGHRLWLFSILALALVSGCAEHFVNRPPSAGEIDEINRIADNGDGPPVITLLPASHAETPDEGGGWQPVRPIVDIGPTEVRRIVAADAAKLTVLDLQGETRSVDLALLDGVMTPNRTRAMWRNGSRAALVGLACATIPAMTALFFGGGPADPPEPRPSSSSSPPVGTAIGILVAGTLIGGILGVVGGYRHPDETFYFGGGAR